MKDVFAKEKVPNPRPSAHGCNACELGDGTIWLLWFAGMREGVEDQRIFGSVCSGGHWSDPIVVVDHLEHRGERWIPEIGAPLLDGDRLWVAFSAAPLSSFYHCKVRNAYVRRLEPALLFLAETDRVSLKAGAAVQILERAGVILQGRSLPLPDGQWLLQCISYDPQDRYSSSLVVGTPGGEWSLRRELVCAPGCLEPSVARFSDGRLACYSRYAGFDGCIWRSESAGTIETLTEPVQTTLRNPHSAIDIAVDEKDRMLIAFNDNHRLRTPLTLGISLDHGRTWRCRDVETEEGEYSYPKFLRTADGCWHLFYTWRRECIAHVRFDPDELLCGRPVFGLEPGA
jgi:hypothetical protein